MVLIWPLLLILLSLACGTSPAESEATQAEPPPLETIRTEEPTVRTYRSGAGWGYDIYRQGKKYIHQPCQPAVGGNRPFPSEAAAKLVGTLMADKLRQGIMPPAVTRAELDSLLRIVD